MEKKRAEDHEVEIAPPVKVDKFGFVKPDQNSPEAGLTRSKSAFEFERYLFCDFLKAIRASVCFGRLLHFSYLCFPSSLLL